MAERPGLAVRFVKRWAVVPAKHYRLRFDCVVFGGRVFNIYRGYWVYPGPLEKLFDKEVPWLR